MQHGVHGTRPLRANRVFMQRRTTEGSVRGKEQRFVEQSLLAAVVDRFQRIPAIAVDNERRDGNSRAADGGASGR